MSVIVSYYDVVMKLQCCKIKYNVCNNLYLHQNALASDRGSNTLIMRFALMTYWNTDYLRFKWNHTFLNSPFQNLLKMYELYVIHNIHTVIHIDT